MSGKRAAALAEDDGVNFGYRYEEHYAIVRDDWRWNRRSGLLNLGRELISQSAGFAQAADRMLAGAGTAAGSALSGALSYLSYNHFRNTPIYPVYNQPVDLSYIAGLKGVADHPWEPSTAAASTMHS